MIIVDLNIRGLGGGETKTIFLKVFISKGKGGCGVLCEKKVGGGGGGGGTKTNYLKHCIAKEDAEFVCLQETKTTTFSDIRCFSLWGTIILGGYIMKVIMGMGA